MNENNLKLQGFGPYQNQERQAPAFRLPAAQGGTVALWDFKQRQAVVLYFLPQGNEAFLSQLQAEYAAYKAKGAQMLVIVPAALEALRELALTLNLSFPLLSDEQGSTYQNYLKLVEADLQTELPAAVFVADRFGAISRYALALLPQGLPPQEEILDMLEFLGNLCNP